MVAISINIILAVRSRLGFVRLKFDTIETRTVIRSTATIIIGLDKYTFVVSQPGYLDYSLCQLFTLVFAKLTGFWISYAVIST